MEIKFSKAVNTADARPRFARYSSLNRDTPRRLFVFSAIKRKQTDRTRGACLLIQLLTPLPNRSPVEDDKFVYMLICMQRATVILWIADRGHILATVPRRLIVSVVRSS